MCTTKTCKHYRHPLRITFETQGHAVLATTALCGNCGSVMQVLSPKFLVRELYREDTP